MIADFSFGSSVPVIASQEVMSIAGAVLLIVIWLAWRPVYWFLGWSILTLRKMLGAKRPYLEFYYKNEETAFKHIELQFPMLQMGVIDPPGWMLFMRDPVAFAYHRIYQWYQSRKGGNPDYNAAISASKVCLPGHSGCVVILPLFLGSSRIYMYWQVEQTTGSDLTWSNPKEKDIRERGVDLEYAEDINIKVSYTDK